MKVTKPPAPTDVCSSCGNTRQWHEKHRPRHDFKARGTN